MESNSCTYLNPHKKLKCLRMFYIGRFETLSLWVSPCVMKPLKLRRVFCWLTKVSGEGLQSFSPTPPISRGRFPGTISLLVISTICSSICLFPKEFLFCTVALSWVVLLMCFNTANTRDQIRLFCSGHCRSWEDVGSPPSKAAVLLLGRDDL